MMKNFFAKLQAISSTLKYIDEISAGYFEGYEIIYPGEKQIQGNDEKLIDTGNVLSDKQNNFFPTFRNSFKLPAEIPVREKHTFPLGRYMHVILTGIPLMFSRLLPVLCQSPVNQSKNPVSHPDVLIGSPEVHMTGTEYSKYKPGFLVILYQIMLTLPEFLKVLTAVPVELSGLLVNHRNIPVYLQHLPATQNSIPVPFRSFPVLSGNISVKHGER